MNIISRESQFQIDKAVGCCREKLDLENIELGDEYFYNSLPLCVIDAVFSIAVRYEVTRNVVNNFCRKIKIKKLRPLKNGYPDTKKQFSIESLLALYEQCSYEEMADTVYLNFNRTSPRSGILKSEAVCHFAKVLYDLKVNYFQDLIPIIGSERFESEIKKID